jgi:hypothetical protein
VSTPKNDPHPAGPSRFTGRQLSFDHDGKRLRGYCTEAVYVGRTARGDIPDYRLTIRGQSGASITVSLVESHASFSDL